MKSATRVTASTFGALVGLAGLEHGIGEMLQGNVAPDGVMIQSWPNSSAFGNLNGEPAFTILPNLLLSGILTILFSLVFITWATVFVEKKRAGLVLILLCVILFLVGGGLTPPILGSIIAMVASKINAPLSWWRAHLPARWRRFLASLWPWAFGACLINWLAVLPGLAILGHFFGVDDVNLILVLIGGMLTLFPLAIVTGFAHDLARETHSPGGPASAVPASATAR